MFEFFFDKMFDDEWVDRKIKLIYDFDKLWVLKEGEIMNANQYLSDLLRVK